MTCEVIAMTTQNRFAVAGAFATLMFVSSTYADDPANKTARAPARDINAPLDLPVLSTHKLDRPPLDDPTADFSVQQAQGGEIRQREKKAPFVRLNLPEPFENKVVIRSTSPEPLIVAPTPQPPK